LRRSHAAEAIKNVDDIWGISDMLVAQKRLRDNMLFMLGINYGLRIGDLLTLRIGDVIDPRGFVKDSVTLSEDKTDKYRTVYNNETTEEAILKYLRGKEVDLDDYLFQSESHNNSAVYYEKIAQKVHMPTDSNPSEVYRVRCGVNGTLSKPGVYKILRRIINEDYGLQIHASSHCLRKTFAYQALITAPDRNRGLELVQKLLNHSSPAVTMRYIGITDEELRDVYKRDIFKRPIERPIDFQRSSGLRYIS
jgi:integrase